MSELSKGRLAAGIGGVLLILSLFLSWYGLKIPDSLAQLSGVTGIDTSVSGWTALGPGDLFLFLVGLIAIFPAVIELFGLEIELPIPLGTAVIGATGLGLLYIVFRLIDPPGPSSAIGIKYGIIVAVVGGVVAAVGGWLIMQEDESVVSADAPLAPMPPAPPVPPAV